MRIAPHSPLRPERYGRLLTVGLAAFALSSCKLTEDNFGVRASERWCTRQKACDEDAFFEQWLLGTPDCREATAKQVDNQRYGNGNVSCTFDPALASACLDTVDSASCEEILTPHFVDRCADVWDCIAIVNPGNP